MGRNYIGSYRNNDIFESRIAAPLDARYIVEEYSDLFASTTWPSNGDNIYIYDGMQVYVNDEQKVYILVDAANYTKPESWKELASDVDASSIKIIDDLTSDDGASALSARQGKVLDNKIRTFRQELFDENDKINSNLLPSFNTGLIYGGTIDSEGMCSLTSKLRTKLGFEETKTTEDIRNLSVKACEDVYFIASEAGGIINNQTLIVPARSAGDWIISDGTKWELILSNAVTSVVGKTGVITNEDIVKAIKYTKGSNPALRMPTYDVINTINGEITTINTRLDTNISPRIDDVNTALTWKTI